MRAALIALPMPAAAAQPTPHLHGRLRRTVRQRREATVEAMVDSLCAELAAERRLLIKEHAATHAQQISAVSQRPVAAQQDVAIVRHQEARRAREHVRYLKRMHGSTSDSDSDKESDGGTIQPLQKAGRPVGAGAGKKKIPLLHVEDNTGAADADDAGPGWEATQDLLESSPQESVCNDDGKEVAERVARGRTGRPRSQTFSSASSVVLAVAMPTMRRPAHPLASQAPCEPHYKQALPVLPERRRQETASDA